MEALLYTWRDIYFKNMLIYLIQIFAVDKIKSCAKGLIIQVH